MCVYVCVCVCVCVCVYVYAVWRNEEEKTCTWAKKAVERSCF